MCCSSGWDIPIETARVARVARAVDDKRIIAPANWLKSVKEAPDDIAGVIAADAGGRCVFRGDGCAIHAALGHAALPAACQHFPRVVLIDARGVFVTLSHYCPTAASLLFADESGAVIVQGPPALPDGAFPEGLDARDALPPLRSPRMLMDFEGYTAWEREVVRALAANRDAAETVDALIGGELPASDLALFDLARASVTSPYTWPAVGPTGVGDLAQVPARPVGRYLAAHAFACWLAYHGSGLRSIAIYVRIVLAVLRVELARRNSLFDAIRQSDLLMRHLVDREALAARIAALSV